MKKVLVFSREAGGAAALAPVVRILKSKTNVFLCGKDFALDRFNAEKLNPQSLLTIDDESVRRIMNGDHFPDLILTSAASLPTSDMTEKKLWVWARKRKIPTIALLDQWQYYSLRFSGPGPDEKLAYIPDVIAVMDDRAATELVTIGISKDRVVVTGQPAFDHLFKLRDSFSANKSAELKRRIGVSIKNRLICFVCESFADDFGDALGFTEFSAFDKFINVCERLVQHGPPMHIALKLHPHNNPVSFNVYKKRIQRNPRLKISIHWTEEPPLPLVLASDIVVGMSSVLLLESILLRQPTISFQPGARIKNNLLATEIGAIPLLNDEDSLLTVMRGILNDANFRSHYLKTQLLLSVRENAAMNVLKLILNILK